MHVETITRFPMKGLNGEALARAEVRPGVGIPGDRALGLKLAHAPEGWQGKHLFLQLANTPALARLRIHYDPASELLVVSEGGELRLRARGAGDAARVEAFFADFVASQGAPRPALRLERNRFPDCPGFDLTLIFRSTVEELSRRLGATLDLARFRMNLVLGGDDRPPFGEEALCGREWILGSAGVFAAERLPRCPATHVDPRSGERDHDVCALLERELGHRDLGILLQVRREGAIAVGDSLGRP
jgi:uncharacterized protein YcbX